MLKFNWKQRKYEHYFILNEKVLLEFCSFVSVIDLEPASPLESQLHYYSELPLLKCEFVF